MTSAAWCAAECAARCAVECAACPWGACLRRLRAIVLSWALAVQPVVVTAALAPSALPHFEQVCNRPDDEENMLLCDGCDRGCHTSCARLRRLPDSPTWFCSGCADKSGAGIKTEAAVASATPAAQQQQQGGGRLQKHAAAPVAVAEVLSDSDDDADIFAPPKVVPTAQVG